MIVKATSIVRDTGEVVKSDDGTEFHVMMRIKDGKEKKFLRDKDGNESDFVVVSDVVKACRLMYRDKKTDKLIDNQKGDTRVLHQFGDGGVLSVNTMTSSKGDMEMLCFFKLNKTDGTFYPQYKMPLDAVKIVAKDIAV